VLLVTAGLAGLGADAPQAIVHLLDDIRQAEQILVDPLQPAQGLSFFILKRLIPAASSKITRRSLAEDCKRTSTFPCSMML